MVQLKFENGYPNESLEIGDLVYYISNPSANYQLSSFTSADDPELGVSTYILIGTVSSIYVNDSPDQNTGSPFTTNNTFTVFVEEVSTMPTAPVANDFIFFAKNVLVEQSSVLGYYNVVTFENNSKRKAELFGVSCGIAESSK
tara:strand:- start:212 stop:640 length:429 start_codon:yes stop_codon:yes gene_type:complete